METLKKHGLCILFVVVFLAASCLAVYKMANHTGTGTVLKTSSLAADTATPATTSPWTDPTILGSIATAIASILGLGWKALQNKDVAGVLKAVESGVAEVQTIKQAVASGIPLEPSVDALAERIYLAEPEEKAVPWAQAGQQRYQYMAKALLAKFTILTKP